MGMLTGFQINLFVDDVERCVEFYRALGFDETFRTPREGRPDHVEVRALGLTLGLASVTAARDVHGLDVSSDGNAAEICLWTDDSAASFRQAVAAGATPVKAPHPVSGGRLTTSWVADPAGNLVEFVQEN
jgi:catechol 2,3-dioxygenase-like lactoylglutathione lyase family enzyme